MSSEQLKKKRKNFSKTLKTQIKRKPHTQIINDIQYTYGLLQKTSQSSLFNNQRFLIIRGLQTFGYARQLPDNIDLPFENVQNIPKCKVQISLDKIQASNEKLVLVVEFQQQDKKQKTRWEFKCGSKAKAIQWRQKLQSAKNDKIVAQQNSAIKVVLQAPNQHIEEDDLNNQARTFQLQLEAQQKLLQNSNHSPPIVQHKIQQNKQDNILVKQDQSQDNEKQKVFNIFENLLGTSTKPLDQFTPKRPFGQNNTKPQPSPMLQNQNSVRKPFFQQLENQISGIQPSPTKSIKQQFNRKKREQYETQTELNQSSQFLGILKVLNDKEFQIEKMKKEWGYEFAKGQNEYEIVEHLKIFVETLTVKIIDELSLDNKKRYYKPTEENSDFILYEVEGVQIKFFLHQLSQVSSFQDKGTIISNERIKLAYQQLKNYNYILQITNNKGRIRVPLAMCVQYKGFVGLAKIIIPESESYENIEPLQKQLDLLQAESRVHNSLFEDSENGRLVPLQSKIYEKLSRMENTPKKFNICYVKDLKYYLPQDFYRFNKNNSPNFLRKELIQDQQYEDAIFYGQNMTKAVNRLKIPQNLKQGVQTLIEVSKTIIQRVNALINSLQNLDETVTNSKDLSNLMHGYGLNIRYLGLLFETSKQNWLKGILMSQIAARCAKSFLKFDLQDCILNLNQTKLENIRKYEIKMVIAFLNKLLGNSQQSEQFWNQLSKQSQKYFSCYLQKSLINVGFFLQSIQIQCSIKLKNLTQQIQYFQISNPLSIQNFSSFEIKSKTYDLNFTQLYTTVNNNLKDLSQQSYEQLSILLNLNRKNSIPSHFLLNNYHQKIILYLINWLPPSQGQSIYYPESIQFGDILPSKSLYQIKLTEIKWLLKQKKQEQSQKVRDWIIQHINRWFGQYHPILSQLYQLFSRYYLNNKYQQKKAITYCKSGIKNAEKLLGSSHFKLADSYYLLSTIYTNYDRKIEALNNLKRAKQILEKIQSQETQAYGIIILRTASLLLASDQIKQSLQYGLQAFQRLIDNDSKQYLVECIEIIGRCYEIDENWEDYLKFSQQINKKITLIYENESLLERVIKIIILPYFRELSKNVIISKKLMAILSNFSEPSFTSNTAYEYVKQKIMFPQKYFPFQFFNQLNILQQILDDIENNGIMTRWKGFQNLMTSKSLLNKIGSQNIVRGFEFLAMLEALNNFVGEGFIEGIFIEV